MVETTDVIFVEEASSDSPLRDRRLVFLGPDQDGVLLEVMAVEVRGFRRGGREQTNLLIIHAMPIREKYRKRYSRGRRDA